MEQLVVSIPERGLKKSAHRVGRTLLATRTMNLMWFDMLKTRARIQHLGRREVTPSYDRLHLGCGSRHISGWLNVDVAGSDCNIDFTSPLPWKANSFSVIVSQHVIEHLELFGELLPMLAELRRVLRAGGEVWLSCPDMKKICQLYADGRVAELVDDRMNRDRRYSTQGAPPQQIVNDLFHQWGEHKNLLDFDIAKWALEHTGFSDVREIAEADLLERFPDFPVRNDDIQTLYVTAKVQ